MLNRDIWDSITIIVATDALYAEFKYITSRLLRQKQEKSISKISFILSSAQAKFLSKKFVKATIKLAQMLKNNNQQRKITAISKDECFNYYKMRYFE